VPTGLRGSGTLVPKIRRTSDANAQYILGYLYYYGYGVPQDQGEPTACSTKLPLQGNEDAKRRLVGTRCVRPRQAR